MPSLSGALAAKTPIRRPAAVDHSGCLVACRSSSAHVTQRNKLSFDVCGNDTYFYRTTPNFATNFLRTGRGIGRPVTSSRTPSSSSSLHPSLSFLILYTLYAATSLPPSLHHLQSLFPPEKQHLTKTRRPLLIHRQPLLPPTNYADGPAAL